MHPAVTPTACTMASALTLGRGVGGKDVIALWAHVRRASRTQTKVAGPEAIERVRARLGPIQKCVC